MVDATLWQCFCQHKAGAKARGVPFKMTYEEWRAIWFASGKLDQRGPRRGQYVMARFKDKGAYEVGNVRIILQEQNTREAWLGRRHSEESRKKMSASAIAWYRNWELTRKV